MKRGTELSAEERELLDRVLDLRKQAEKGRSSDERLRRLARIFVFNRHRLEMMIREVLKSGCPSANPGAVHTKTDCQQCAAMAKAILKEFDKISHGLPRAWAPDDRRPIRKPHRGPRSRKLPDPWE